MKKTIFCIAVSLLGFVAASAQVKLGLGLGYAIPSGDIKDILDGGVSFNLEAGYGVTEDIDVSLLYQADLLVGIDEGGSSFGNLTIGSILANGRYFFIKEKFRPYAALGIGIASVGAVEIEADSAIFSGSIIAAESTSNFAVRPAIGFKYGVLNVNAAYLSAGKIDSIDTSVGDISFNIGLLFTIGGN